MEGVEVAGLDVYEHVHAHLQSTASTHGYRLSVSYFTLKLYATI